MVNALLHNSPLIGPTRLSFPHLTSFPARRRNHFAPVRAKSSTVHGARLVEAAKLTVNTCIRSGMVVGLGSGRASDLVIQYLGRQLREGKLKDIVGIPTSVSSASEAAKAGIPLEQYPTSLQIDFTFDDADIIEEGTLAAVIGRRKLQGGESIIQEKSVLTEAKKAAFIVIEKQYKKDLDGAIPVLVKTVWRRPSLGHAGPTGGDFPLVTREGHNVLDVIFTSPILNLAEVAESLSRINGVVDHGVIVGIPCLAVIASEDGLQTIDNLSQSVLKGL